MADYIAISYGVCVATVVAFALYAAAMFTARLLKQKAADAAGQASTATTEDFITARLVVPLALHLLQLYSHLPEGSVALLV